MVFALSLSLCACGAPKEYQPLLDSLESGDYESVRQALSELSAEYAAEQEELNTYRKYEALIDSLEKGDSAAAEEELAKQLPEPTEPAYEELFIDIENWKDYFEIVEEEDWQLNGFGESEGYSRYYHFKLRDEYLLENPPKQIDLTVELAYTAHDYDVNVDLVGRTVSIGETDPDVGGSPTGAVKKVYDVQWLQPEGILVSVQCYLTVWDSGKQTLYALENVPTVSRIEGTLLIPEQ